MDVRIAAATVRLAANELETVGFTLGLRRQNSELRRLADAVTRLQQSANTGATSQTPIRTDAIPRTPLKRAQN